MPFDKTEYAKEFAESEADTGAKRGEGRILTLLYLVVAVLVALWTGSVALFGLPGLVLPALVMVPVMVMILVRLTRG